MGRIVSLCGGGSRVRLFFRRGKSQQWAENTIPPNTCQAIEGDKQLAGFHASLANAEEGNIPGFPKTPGNRCQPSYQPNMSFNVQPMAYTTDSIKGEVIGKFDLYKNPMDLIRNSLVFEVNNIDFSFNIVPCPKSLRRRIQSWTQYSARSSGTS